jgi:hypothetical protein
MSMQIPALYLLTNATPTGNASRVSCGGSNGEERVALPKFNKKSDFKRGTLKEHIMVITEAKVPVYTQNVAGEAKRLPEKLPSTVTIERLGNGCEIQVIPCQGDSRAQARDFTVSIHLSGKAAAPYLKEFGLKPKQCGETFSLDILWQALPSGQNPEASSAPDLSDI